MQEIDENANEGQKSSSQRILRLRGNFTQRDSSKRYWSNCESTRGKFINLYHSTLVASFPGLRIIIMLASFHLYLIMFITNGSIEYIEDRHLPFSSQNCCWCFVTNKAEVLQFLFSALSGFLLVQADCSKWKGKNQQRFYLE